MLNQQEPTVIHEKLSIMTNWEYRPKANAGKNGEAAIDWWTLPFYRPRYSVHLGEAYEISQQ